MTRINRSLRYKTINIGYYNIIIEWNTKRSRFLFVDNVATDKLQHTDDGVKYVVDDIEFIIPYDGQMVYVWDKGYNEKGVAVIDEWNDIEFE